MLIKLQNGENCCGVTSLNKLFDTFNTSNLGKMPKSGIASNRQLPILSTCSGALIGFGNFFKSLDKCTKWLSLMCRLRSIGICNSSMGIDVNAFVERSTTCGNEKKVFFQNSCNCKQRKWLFWPLNPSNRWMCHLQSSESYSRTYTAIECPSIEQKIVYSIHECDCRKCRASANRKKTEKKIIIWYRRRFFSFFQFNIAHNFYCWLLSSHRRRP